jgi:hypothetical protein
VDVLPAALGPAVGLKSPTAPPTASGPGLHPLHGCHNAERNWPRSRLGLWDGKLAHRVTYDLALTPGRAATVRRKVGVDEASVSGKPGTRGDFTKKRFGQGPSRDSSGRPRPDGSGQGLYAALLDACEKVAGARVSAGW